MGDGAHLVRISRSMSAIAFHEKAGRSQVDSFVFLLDKFFFSGRVSRCRHPSIRLKHVDNLGAYSIPSGDGLLIPSDYVNHATR
jgi:hypothetical protein